MAQVPCDQCGDLRTAVAFRAQDGRVLCRTCRGGVGRPRKGAPSQIRLTVCPQCGYEFVQKHRGRTTVTCSLSCANLRRNGVVPGFAHKSPHNLRRRRLEASQPGLGRWARKELLRKLIGESTPCAYCGNPAETLDHVVPLHCGGTNFEDNLAPACRPCNTSKGRKTLEEWGGRRGHPLHGVRQALSGEAGFGDVLRRAVQEAGAAESESSRYRDRWSR